MSGQRDETLKDIVGRVPVKIDVSNNEIVIHFKDGGLAKFFHHQQCCECVEVEEVAGDWHDLIGHPILVADERIHEDDAQPPPPGCKPDNESNTWTFYTFRSVGGTVDVRWHGSSTGWYGERVSVHVTPPGAAP